VDITTAVDMQSLPMRDVYSRRRERGASSVGTDP
jgi:hypothetical protein